MTAPRSDYFPMQEEIVNLLITKTQSQQTHFFRLLVAYHFTKMASAMRTNIDTKDRGVIPVNMYCLNLAISGAGKGHSTNIMEELITDGFKETFLEQTLPTISQQNLIILANERAVRDGLPQESWVQRINKEYEALGNYAWSFDSATTPAIKQFRQKLLLSSIGSMNLEMDEVGSNFLGNLEVLATFLELFDKGLVKQKLTKNTQENLRSEEVKGYTPTNMMLFGTPIKLFDGSKTEDDFVEMLETGFARRLFFGFSDQAQKIQVKDGAELYDLLTDQSLDSTIDNLSKYFRQLGSLTHINPVINVSRQVTIDLLNYKLECERKAAQFAEHEEMFEAEMSHRYYKALKLAGVYAFMDMDRDISQDHLRYAIQLTEDSGDHFHRMMNKDGPYVRLAKYLATCGEPQTHVDLMENLTFFRGSKQVKEELITLASAYGCKHNIAIQRKNIDGVEFLSGETLKATDIDKVQVSFSQDIAQGYETHIPKFSQLHKLVTAPGYHYCVHGFNDGHRHKEKAIPGFNLAILDMDDGTSLNTVMKLLDGYMALYATTKSHTPDKNRFRVILPLSHFLKLDPDDYTQFMENIFNWLPFDPDSQGKDIARKWESFPGEYVYTDGELLDATWFIPKTQKEQQQRQQLNKYSQMNQLERWFARNTKVGNRSNMLLRYGYVLIDVGKSMDEIEDAVKEFNKRLDRPLNVQEVERTVLTTLRKRALQN